MFKKSQLVLAAAIAVAAASVGTVRSLGAEERPTIAYITPGLNVPFWTRVYAGVQREAKKMC